MEGFDGIVNPNGGGAACPMQDQTEAPDVLIQGAVNRRIIFIPVKIVH